uniref:Major facilitator superfamily (MFS) profile domain-containing protein n=1 Tax=Oryza barthii TaxID=65489 RepID=A0A0D3GSF1_9ORYZ
MADAATTPLLTSHEAKPAKALSIDDAIETYIGATGARQLLTAMLLAFAWAFEAQQVFMPVFTDAEPTWHCTGVAAGDPGSFCSLAAASASSSACALPPGTFSMLHACATEREDDAAGGAGGGGGGVFATLRSMWERRWALRRLAAIMTASFGVGMVYYGMPLNVGNLGSNLYLSVTYNALAEFPSSVLSWLLMGRINRRSSVVALTAAAGVCSLACVAIPEGTGGRMAAEVLSFFATCTAFNIILMYSIELFPTSVRNSAVGMVRQALVLGGVRSYWSFGVFGLTVGCLGLFVTCLPETKGRRLSDTMEDEEEAAAVLSGG